MSEKTKVGLTRREFLTLAGLTSLAIPTRGLLDADSQSAVKQELDPAGRSPRPWWVETVEQPTTEVDWVRKQRYDASLSVDGSGKNLGSFLGEKEADFIEGINKRNIRQRVADNIPGYTLKDFSLLEAQKVDVFDGNFLGPDNSPSPDKFGSHRWETDPDEAARVVRVAMRHFGAAQVGFIRLDENTRKLIYSVDRDGKSIEFENVPFAYETSEKRVIPTKVQWVIAYTVRMSIETLKRAPTATGAQTCMLSYSRGRHIQNHTQAFLRGLGYQALGQAPLNGLGLSVAFGVLAGLGELSRQNRMITPEYGPMVRAFFMLTDLPVAVDKPIDAGISRFCRVCKKCAEACPVSALSFDDLPRWETHGAWNNPGHRAYFEDSVTCMRYWRETALTDCGICFAVCPFAKKDKAWLHDLVKAGIAKAPMLNQFIRSLDDAFSYGAKKDPEAWWHQNLPEYGLE